MKIQLITATALLALFTASTASAHSVKAKNDALNSIAIGGELSVGGGGAFGVGAGGATFSSHQAIAGSIVVNCDCEDVDANNFATNSLAVGNAVSGSIVTY